MEIRVNSFGCARSGRFIFLSPPPAPLPCEFPRWQPKRRLSPGMGAWEQGHCPVRHQLCFKALDLVGGIAGDSLDPPEMWWPAHFVSGFVNAEGYVCALGAGSVP